MTQIRTSISDTNQRQRICRGLFFVLLLGLALGAFLAWRIPALADTAVFQQGCTEPAAGRNLLTVFRDSLCGSAVCLLLILLCGFFPLGQPLSLVVLLLRGAALGCAAAETYGNFGTRGLPVVLFLQLPDALATSLLLVLAVREALKLSTSFLGFALSDCERDGLREDCHLYFLRFLVLAGFLLVTAAADTALTYLLAPLLLPI